MSRFFVTATGTEIGKSFVTCGLIHAARQAGRSARAIKPLVSGFDEAAPEGSDPARLAEALGLPLNASTLERIAPWRYEAPLAPDMAAKLEGRSVPYPTILEFCRAALAGPDEIVLVEGVGGVMVPLDERHTVLDWMTALKIPALLVAGSYLGTISHTLTAILALQLAQIPIAGVIISESPTSPVPLGELAATLARFAGDLTIAMVPRASHPGDPSVIAALRPILAAPSGQP
jgi:dethiobiotin synthetase